MWQAGIRLRGCYWNPQLGRWELVPQGADHNNEFCRSGGSPWTDAEVLQSPAVPDALIAEAPTQKRKGKEREREKRLVSTNIIKVSQKSWGSVLALPACSTHTQSSNQLAKSIRSEITGIHVSFESHRKLLFQSYFARKIWLMIRRCWDPHTTRSDGKFGCTDAHSEYNKKQ